MREDIKKEREEDAFIKEKELWRKRWRGESEEGLICQCTMPGCHRGIFDDCEYYKDDSGNIFCSLECVLEWYGIVRVNA